MGQTARDIARSVEDSIRRGELRAGRRAAHGAGPGHRPRRQPVDGGQRLPRVAAAWGAGRIGAPGHPRPAAAAGLLPAAHGRSPRDPGPAHRWTRPRPPAPAPPAGRSTLTRATGHPPVSPRLAQVAGRRLEADGIDGSSLAVVGGALDGVERVLGAWLHPGDRVVVEDPGYTASLDLLVALGMEVVPVGDGRAGHPPRPARRRPRAGCRCRAGHPPGPESDRRGVGRGTGRRTGDRSCPGIRTSSSSRTTMPARRRGCPPGRCAGPGSAGPRSARCPSGSAPTCGSPSWPVTRPP